MSFRKILFWLHLCTGVGAGVVVLIMSVTGVLLMYEKQLTAWADRGYRVTPLPQGQRLPVETLLSKVRDQRSALPSTLTLRADAREPAALAFGREGVVYVNPYTGETLGEGSKGVRTFFRVVTDWHRWLGAHGESRAVARSITGACNLGFLFLVVSGFYIWWPKQWTWAQLRNVTWFRRGLPGKARDFNWHNVIGFWSAVPLFIVVLSATVISYPWASNLVYRIVGEEPPIQGGPAGQGAGTGGPRRQGPGAEGEVSGRSDSTPQGSEVRRAGGRPNGAEEPRRVRREGPGAGGPFAAPPVNLNLEGLDRLWSRAEQQLAGWQSISLRLPSSADAPLSFTIDQGNGGQPQMRAQLTLNRTTGEVMRWEPFSSMTLGRRLRMVLRFAHTGEVVGTIGQTIAGVVSAGASVLVYTGLALSWRRFRAWQARRRSQELIATPLKTESPDRESGLLSPHYEEEPQGFEVPSRPLP
jgi:uncharacterized iron-regulated membrane protein